MKKITINLPTSFKEFSDGIKSLFKLVRHPNRYPHNQQVFKELDRELCALLNSGYWSADISETMRKRLTCGLPNGEISRLVWKTFRKLK